MAMDVDRNGVHLAIARRRLDDRFGHEGGPLVLVCNHLDVREQIPFDEFVELLASIELHGGRRIAADRPIDRDGARVHASRDRIVNPDTASFGEPIGKNFHCSGLTT
jgi:hypothetical protein